MRQRDSTHAGSASFFRWLRGDIPD